MLESDCGHRFHNLKLLKLDFLFIFLEFIIHLRASSHKFVESHPFYVILSYSKQFLENYLHTTCTVFKKYADFSWTCFCHHKLLDFVD